LPSGSFPQGITLGPDGNIWFTEHVANQIGVIKLTGTPPTPTGISANSGPVGITSADGYLWFTQNLTDQIGRLDPSTGQISEYSVPSTKTHFLTTLDSRIVLGPDGNLWFTEFGAILAFDPKNPGSGTTLSVVETVTLPGGSNEEPFGLTAGPGDTIWYTEGVFNSSMTGYASFGVGAINTNTDTLILNPEIQLCASCEPYGITAGPDGNIWFTVTSADTVAGTIDEINPSTDTITETLAVPTNVVSTPNPLGITAGPDGNIWFADGSGAIGVVDDTQLVVTAQPPPDVSVNSPFGITVTDQYASGVADTAFNGNVTIALAHNPGGGSSVLGGTVTVAAVNGVATFAGLTINNVGNGYTLQATSNASNGPTSVATTGFNVVRGPATQLVVTTEPPGTVTAGSGFAVTVDDEYVLSGPVDTAFNGNVTIALGANPGGSGSSLGGTVTVAAVNGVASFSALTINNAGNGYTLIVSGGGLTPVPTNSFNVTPPPPPPPTITGELVAFNQKRNKKGNPIGRPTLAGYTFDFSTAMNQASIGAPANYVVDMLVLKKQGKHKKVLVPQPIGFTVTNVTSTSVTLTLAGKQKFPKGGQITVIASPPGGVENTSGVFLAPNAILTISPGGKAIS